MGKSCSYLSDSDSEDSSNSPQTRGGFPKTESAPDIMTSVDDKLRGNDEANTFSSEQHQKIIIVANFLPLKAQKDKMSGKWCFTYDEDSILLPLKDSLSSNTEVFYVGSLNVDVDASEQENVSLQLQEKFNCLPTFIPSDLHKQFYDGFCKRHLWPLFHSILPLNPDCGNRFDNSLWEAYVSANKIFAHKVMEVINPKLDYVWVHDYHLLVIATYLREQYNWIKLGFFLHSPFPSPEIYGALPVRDTILEGLLNADLIGFHTFDYAHHFLSCCRRILGLEYKCQRDHIKLEYGGRIILIKFLPIGIDMCRLQSALGHPSFTFHVRKICEKLKGKKLILGVDDMDIFKGISLKLIAFEQLLQQHHELRGEIILVQIVNPPRSTGKDVDEARNEVHVIANRINESFGSFNYKPVIIVNRYVPMYEKASYYALAECCIVNAVRDGMNLVPYEYTVCREGSNIGSDTPRTSALVVSEFIGCSTCLSGAIRVNPWDINAVAKLLNLAITMTTEEKQLRHEKHYRYISSHDVAYWARSFVQDLEHLCKDHHRKNYWKIGSGLNLRVLSLSRRFRKLKPSRAVSSYERTNCRALFLDCDGTVVPSIDNTPSPEIIDILNNLCSDPKNIVFIISDRGKTTLSEWFGQCQNLCLAAEHGYFMKWSQQSTWEMSHTRIVSSWKDNVEPLMRMTTEATDGSYVETKETALVWHYSSADPGFGTWQAKLLLDHLHVCFSNEPVTVNRGKHFVEVKLQGITKGLAVEDIVSKITKDGKSLDFILCIGDDKSDEDMFESLQTKTNREGQEIFACTVGKKPSKARYYLDDTNDVKRLLRALSTLSLRPEED